jgi:uncharacterized iron-regulated membrane protein
MRYWVLRLHRWAGLSIGIALIFIAATGATIAFRRHLEPIVNRDLLTVPACTGRVPIDTLAAKARAAHPDGHQDYVRITNVADDPARTRAAQIRVRGEGTQDDIFLNPCTGDVLGQRARYGGVLGYAEGLHKLRFLPGGQLVAGWIALLSAIFLIAGGLYMWWPRLGRSFQSATRFNSRLSGRGRTLDQHKVVGAYASLVVLSSAITGLPQAFDPVRSALYWMTGSPSFQHEYHSKPVAGAAFLPLEAYWTKAQSLVPQPREALMHFPDAPAAPVEMYLIPADAPHPNARTLLALDAYDGSVLMHVPYAQSSLGHRIYFWSLSWHDGALLWLAGPLVLMLGALSTVFLGYTGLSSYLRRLAHKKRGAAARAASSSQASSSQASSSQAAE